MESVGAAKVEVWVQQCEKKHILGVEESSNDFFFYESTEN